MNFDSEDDDSDLLPLYIVLPIGVAMILTGKLYLSFYLVNN